MTNEEQKEFFAWFLALGETQQIRCVSMLIENCTPDTLEAIRRAATLDRS
jgi:hypothetical protein